jgi:hypothetical protein
VDVFHHLLLSVQPRPEWRIDGEYGHFVISLVLVAGKPTLGQYLFLVGKTKWLIGVPYFCW